MARIEAQAHQYHNVHVFFLALPQIVWVNFSDSPLLDKDQGHHNESKLQF